MFVPEDVLKMMGLRVRNVCGKVIPQERPNATTDGLAEFIVVSLPFAIYNETLGENDDWWIDTTVAFEIYVADEKSANNPKRFNDKRMKLLRKEVLELFPMVEKSLGIKIVQPRIVIPAASDGNGYHYTRIQARMSTMV